MTLRRAGPAPSTHAHQPLDSLLDGAHIVFGQQPLHRFVSPDLKRARAGRILLRESIGPMDVDYFASRIGSELIARFPHFNLRQLSC
jgi:hypothetical protein